MDEVTKEEAKEKEDIGREMRGGKEEKGEVEKKRGGKMQ